MEVTLGGNRLGSGNKNKIYARDYERSTHDLGFVWRSTMASGTLVPFLTEVALPGDTMDIDLDIDALTHPTIGPLFGSYKLQLDVFQVPFRLYQGELHMNMLGIGMDMSKVRLPQMLIEGPPLDPTQPLDNQHINPSSIFSYLGIRGNGVNATNPAIPSLRYFNAIPYLAYWDIYKNYYANKQEEIGLMIHKDLSPQAVDIAAATIKRALPETAIPVEVPAPPYTYAYCNQTEESYLLIQCTGVQSSTNLDCILINVYYPGTDVEALLAITAIWQVFEIYPASGVIIGSQPFEQFKLSTGYGNIHYDGTLDEVDYNAEPNLHPFPLSAIDDMRKKILAWPTTNAGYPLTISKLDPSPYGRPFDDNGGTPLKHSKNYNQEGLALKTYNSDLFNNWISTEWIDGPDGISAVTAIDTSDGSFTIDELNLSKKIYDMLNRIALSGGTYDDWLDAVYTHDRIRGAENPIYLGGLIKNLVFQEVISNAQTPEQPLGTLAGRGRIGSKHKGGKIIAKIDEPSYIMGIVSITPNIDYSQGNKWDMNLRTMNDLHKPALDEIGFQDLITDQMAWFDTSVDSSGSSDPINIFKSAGKQPAWINYMTNVNTVKGNFADATQQMFMVLNRRYEPNANGNLASIGDLTTYIDPSKFNHIFADTRRDAQNFWVQIGVQNQARRKMSAKVIPNL